MATITKINLFYLEMVLLYPDDSVTICFCSSELSLILNGYLLEFGQNLIYNFVVC